MAEARKTWVTRWLDARDGPNTRSAMVLDLRAKAEADELEARELRNRAAELQHTAEVARRICDNLAMHEASKP